jgi:hypothetical protein
MNQDETPKPEAATTEPRQPEVEQRPEPIRNVIRKARPQDEDRYASAVRDVSQRRR